MKRFVLVLLFAAGLLAIARMPDRIAAQQASQFAHEHQSPDVNQRHDEQQRLRMPLKNY
jgi:hypothetical protein